MALGVVFINPEGGAPPQSEWLGDYARGGAGDDGGAGSSSRLKIIMTFMKRFKAVAPRARCDEKGGYLFFPLPRLPHILLAARLPAVARRASAVTTAALILRIAAMSSLRTTGYGTAATADDCCE